MGNLLGATNPKESSGQADKLLLINKASEVVGNKRIGNPDRVPTLRSVQLKAKACFITAS